MTNHTNKHSLSTLATSAVGAALALMVASCNASQGGFSGSVGNTPSGPPITSYRVLGTIGEPFSATVSNARSSWLVTGTVPLSMDICNNVTPAEIIAMKTANDTNLLSIEIINGQTLLGVASTSLPFGSVSLQTGGKLQNISPAADPDLRIFVAGPSRAPYTALVEDEQTGFVVKERAPTLIFFDTPNGKVDGTFFPNNRDFGKFDLTMTLGTPPNDEVVAHVVEGPTAFIRE